MKNSMKVFAVVSVLTLSLLGGSPATAQGSCPSIASPVASDADLSTVIQTADDIAAQLPSRTRIATLEDDATRIFLSTVLDHVETAQRIDQLTALEREQFGDDLYATASAAQIGVAPCTAVAEPTQLGTFDETDGTFPVAPMRPGDDTTPLSPLDDDCSCVQQCYNEWKDNYADCNGSYWCEVGVTLLFELCLADCLVPG